MMAGSLRLCSLEMRHILVNGKSPSLAELSPYGARAW